MSLTIGKGYAGLEKCGYKHFAATQLGDASVTEECLPIIHLVFANLKSWLLGTHHGVGHQHLQAYLNEFTFRFNRRFYPFNSFRSLLGLPVPLLLRPTMNFTPENGTTLHLVVLGDNRIGTVHSYRRGDARKRSPLSIGAKKAEGMPRPRGIPSAFCRWNIP